MSFHDRKGLRFVDLREANKRRLPEFKNSKGEAAHNKPDGSDWSPAQWFQALVGELGEFAEVRMEFERGKMTFEEYAEKAQKELADINTYLDLLAWRSMDSTEQYKRLDDPQTLMAMVAMLGSYANNRKKFERGDIDFREFENRKHFDLGCAAAILECLRKETRVGGNAVSEAHPVGVELGAATSAKFNEVSLRVGSGVWIDTDGDWFYEYAGAEAK